MNLKEGVILTGLLLGTIVDLRRKELPLWYLLLMAAGGILLQGWSRDLSLLEMLGGILVGVFFLAANQLSRGGIGIGDGLLLAATGISLGFTGNLILAGNGLLFSSVFALGSYLIRRDRKLIFPFVPFLFLAYIWMLIL